jgi:hypothetical protein
VEGAVNLILIDGPHDGVEVKNIEVRPGDTLTITDHPAATYVPVMPYPSRDGFGRVRMTSREEPLAAHEVLQHQEAMA